MPCPCERKSDFPSASAEGNNEHQRDLSFWFWLLMNVSAGNTATWCVVIALKTEKGQIFISAQGLVSLTVPVCLPQPAVGWGEPATGWDNPYQHSERQGRERWVSGPACVASQDVTAEAVYH